MARVSRNISLVAVLAAFALSGCHKSDTAKGTPGNNMPSTSRAAGGSGATMTDADVRNAVQAELNKDGKIDGADISVAVRDGIVELTGKVTNPLSKERANRIAEAVRGVRSVSNRLDISAPPRPDEDIQRDVQRALQYTAATSKMPIHVAVSRGIVTLSGPVESWQEQQLAGRIADGVRGVRYTQNTLTTERKPKRDDAAILRDVKSRLAWDALVEHDPIGAMVKNGRVTLTGAVGSMAEKSRAIADASVDGVQEVDPLALEVKWWDRPDKNLAPGVPKSDAEIAAAIKEAALQDPRIRSYDVHPSVAGGVVTLTGTVGSVNAKMAAEGVARNTVGVVQVKNQLETVSEQAISDAVLQGRIQETLEFDPFIVPGQIHISVDQGHVKLTGSVATYFERAEAFDAASRIAGVTRVDDELTVREPSSPYVFSPYLDPYTPYVGTWYFVPSKPAASDAELTTRINTDLQESPFVHADLIHVRVQDGKATLTGTVPTFRDRNVATREAFQAGAIAVDNELKVG
jgi:osmotically-inducible protein OsmY